jgi:hypothetical protein
MSPETMSPETLSPWMENSLIVGGMVLLAIAGTALSRRLVGAEKLGRNNEVAGFIYAVIGVVYAVLLGLSAVIVWEQYDRAKAIAEHEANEIADLYRGTPVYPEAIRKELQSRLRTYTQLVVEKEWPAMAERKASPETAAAYDEIWRAYQSFEPVTEQQKLWYAAALDRLTDLSDNRRLRLLSSGAEGVPRIMWIVLFGTGIVTIAYSFLFGTRSAAAHLMMTGGLAITIGLVLLSLLAMHHPYSGIARVDPEAFLQVLETFGGDSLRGTTPQR